MATQNKNNSSNKNAENSNSPAANANKAGEVSKAMKLTSEQESLWTEKRKALLATFNVEVSKLDASKLLDLAQKSVARLLDNKHNTASAKLALLDSAEPLTLEMLLSSKRLSAASKENVQEAFGNLLMSGTLAGEAKAEALATFKGGKIADMQAFLSKHSAPSA